MAIEELQGGRYRYERLLGSGGMGDVYLMKDTRVSRRVAIKVVRAEGSIESERATDATRLFQREAKAIAALEHPNILPLYDFGEETRDGMTVTYMVMPYCADGSLEIWLRKQQRDQLCSPQQVAYLIEQAAEALQYAHDHEVIHLDVKPSNFLLRRNRKNPQRPTLLLADFGIARNFTTVANSSRTIRGTPTSMAPEQWSGSPVFASDQYALAVMTYELLTGRPPFVGSMEQLMYQHFTVQAPPPSKFNPRLPEAFDPVLLRALAKKPEERFPSIADFASALSEAAQQPAPPFELTENNDLANYATQAISQEEDEARISHVLTQAGSQEEIALVVAGTREEHVVQEARAHKVPAPVADLVMDVAVPEEVLVNDEEMSADETPASDGLVTEEGEEESAKKPPKTPRFDLQTPAEHDLPTVATDKSEPVQMTRAPLPVPQAPSARRPGVLIFASIIAVLALIMGTTSFYYFAHPRQPSSTSNRRVNSAAGAKTTVTPLATLTSTPSSTSQPGLFIAGKYNGTMEDQTTYQITQLSVSLVQVQGQGALQGTVAFNINLSAQQGYQLSGTVDLQGNFTFTVQQPSGQLPLVFYGSFQSNTDLKGYYCHSTTNTCQTNEGFFTVGPRYQS